MSEVVYVTIGSRNCGVRSVSYVREVGTAALTLMEAELEEDVKELVETELLDEEEVVEEVVIELGILVDVLCKLVEVVEEEVLEVTEIVEEELL